MKKLLIALTIACSVLTMSAAATEVKVSAKVLQAFKNNFNSANSVTWQQVDDLFQADFKLDDQKYSAYFNADGEMVVVARFITLEQLPHLLKSSLLEEAQDGQVSYVFELSDNEGVHFYATIQKGEKKEMVRSMGAKKWAPYKKLKI
jgi:opacity protein-like surface antigen